MFEFILLTNLILLGLIYSSKKIFLSSYVTLIFFYQQLYPFVYFYFVDYLILFSFDKLVPSLSDQNVLNYSITSLIFQFFIVLGYYSKRNNVQFYRNKTLNYNLIKVIIFYILICGIIAVINNSGENAVSTYNEFLIDDIEISQKTRPLAYGFSLLPIAIILLMEMIYRVEYKKSLYIFISMTPLLYEIFSAGRRQAFVPIFLLILIYLVQKEMIDKKKLIFYVPLLFLVILFFFGIQFSLRSIATGSSIGNLFYVDDIIEGIFQPQIGEFVAVGATSLSAYILFIDINTFDPFGLVSLINKIIISLPVIRQLSTTDIYPNPSFDIKLVAPYGALSIYAEAVMYLGFLGIICSGFIMGYLISFANTIIYEVKKIEFITKNSNILLLGLVVILFFKYRSGIVDMISSTVFFMFVFYLLQITTSFLKK